MDYPLVRKRLHPMLQITKSTRFGKNRSFHEKFILSPTFCQQAKSDIFTIFIIKGLYVERFRVWLNESSNPRNFAIPTSQTIRAHFNDIIYSTNLPSAQKTLKADFDRKSYFCSFRKGRFLSKIIFTTENG